MKRSSHLPSAADRRSAFTLLELLAVITIISILLALILPAIGGAMRNARNAEVSAEITRLETAIASFKAEYGIEPWDTIVLTEDPTQPNSAWSPDARTKLRRIWPQFTFTGQIDFNDDGVFEGDSDPSHKNVTLTLSECLVFFLGGMQSGGDVIGFSKNPLNPFSKAGQNRTARLMDFDNGRLVDTDSDGMLEYVDPLPDQKTPYAYSSNNNGQGYTSGVFYVDGTGKPWKKDSHQIISPGEDGEFAAPSATPPVYTDGIDLSGNRRTEADNITNFSTGTLD